MYVLMPLKAGRAFPLVGVENNTLFKASCLLRLLRFRRAGLHSRAGRL